MLISACKPTLLPHCVRPLRNLPLAAWNCARQLVRSTVGEVRRQHEAIHRLR